MDNKQILEALDDIVTFREEPISEQIEALMEAMDIVEKYSKIGGWIPCSERLPEEKINPVTNDFYEYQVTFKSDKLQALADKESGFYKMIGSPYVEKGKATIVKDEITKKALLSAYR